MAIIISVRADLKNLKKENFSGVRIQKDKAFVTLGAILEPKCDINTGQNLL